MTCVPWADFIKEKLLREDPPSPKKLLAHSRVGQWQFFSTTEMQDRMRILPNLLKRRPACNSWRYRSPNEQLRE